MHLSDPAHGCTASRGHLPRAPRSTGAWLLQLAGQGCWSAGRAVVKEGWSKLVSTSIKPANFPAASCKQQHPPQLAPALLEEVALAGVPYRMNPLSRPHGTAAAKCRLSSFLRERGGESEQVEKRRDLRFLKERPLHLRDQLLAVGGTLVKPIVRKQLQDGAAAEAAR